METKELVERLKAPSVLISGAPGLLEYLPGKKRIGPPDNITAIIQRLEKNCRDAATALEAAERQIGHKAALQAQLKALRPYLAHHIDCCNSADECDCGLVAAQLGLDTGTQAQIEADNPEEPS